MKFDLKSAVIGLLLGIVVMLAAGASKGGGSADIGFAVPSGGQAVLKSSDNEAFIVDMGTGMAKQILYKKAEPGELRYPNNINGYALTLAD
jgi:hypothetical protein